LALVFYFFWGRHHSALNGAGLTEEESS
jgi:hypothetical protein